MAIKLKKKRIVRKKRVIPFLKKRKNKPVIRRFSPMLPDQCRMFLPYVQNGVITTTVTAASQVFYGNSIYDCDYTGAGHQPLYRDFWATVYASYRVIGCTITLSMITTSGACFSSLHPQIETTASSAVVLDAEKPYAKSILTNSGAEAKTIKIYMNTSKIYGLTGNTLMGDNQYAAASTAVPAKPWFWILSFQHPDGSTSQTTSYKVKLVYDVIMYDRIRQNQS